MPWWIATLKSSRRWNSLLSGSFRSNFSTFSRKRTDSWSDVKTWCRPAGGSNPAFFFFFFFFFFFDYYSDTLTTGLQCRDRNFIKGSVERSLLPIAIFLIFTRNRPWKSEDHLCTLFFIEMSKERLEKGERTPPVSRSTVQLFMPVSGVEKPPFSQFFSRLWVSFGEEKPFVTSNASF